LIDVYQHKDLVEACSKQNRDAQFRLYRQYSDAMYNLAFRMLKNEMDAEDVLQKSFLDIFKNIHKFQFHSTIGAWIKRIVINNCISFLKKKRLEFEAIDDRTASIPEPEVREETLSVDTINRAIMKLPDGYRVVLSLYLLEGYDHGEIAQILGISESTSKSQYSRAKLKMQRLLTEKEFLKDTL